MLIDYEIVGVTALRNFTPVVVIARSVCEDRAIFAKLLLVAVAVMARLTGIDHAADSRIIAYFEFGYIIADFNHFSHNLVTGHNPFVLSFGQKIAVANTGIKNFYLNIAFAHSMAGKLHCFEVFACFRCQTFCFYAAVRLGKGCATG